VILLSLNILVSRKIYNINKQQTLADLNSRDDQQKIVAVYHHIQAEALIRMRERLSEEDSEHTEEDKKK